MPYRAPHEVARIISDEDAKSRVDRIVVQVSMSVVIDPDAPAVVFIVPSDVEIPLGTLQQKFWEIAWTRRWLPLVKAEDGTYLSMVGLDTGMVAVHIELRRPDTTYLQDERTE